VFDHRLLVVLLVLKRVVFVTRVTHVMRSVGHGQRLVICLGHERADLGIGLVLLTKIFHLMFIRF
jgi:hypothetical protein